MTPPPPENSCLKFQPYADLAGPIEVRPPEAAVTPTVVAEPQQIVVRYGVDDAVAA